MIASSHPLAVSTSLEALADGGSAADAAIVAAAVLCVVDPRSTGIGGDAFALYWETGGAAPVGLGAAGVAPRGMTVDAIHAADHDEMPALGAWTITIPGAVAGWKALHERYGRLAWERLLQPAIEIAYKGCEIAPMIADEWAMSRTKLQINPESTRLFLLDGDTPSAGHWYTAPELGRSLEMIAEGGAESFYKGTLADAIGQAVQDLGGPLQAQDLAEWSGPEWVAPIGRLYKGITVFEYPPPGQGLITLQALGIYEGLGLSDRIDEEHAGIESIKLAFADAVAFVADPRVEEVRVEALLRDEYLSRRRASIDMSRAQAAAAGSPGDTVYLCVVDRDGAACSFIQSLYEGFGSGVSVPGTGITLHNRGSNFSLDPGRPNRVEPGKRPYHTIMPAMLGADVGFAGCLGVVGGFQQPQAQFQIVRNLLDRGMDPQEAVAAPRWRHLGGLDAALEPGFDDSIVEGLREREHNVSHLGRFEAGGAQLIVRRGDLFVGGSDPRKDGMARGL
jgi:gamma-glutamyltranspeptidase/glutathione hydrolase